jgi:cytochrome b subunit of formate dehydrogenase
MDRPDAVLRHARWVRISHWILTVSVLTLAFTGGSHARPFTGEVSVRPDVLVQVMPSGT